MRVIDCRRAAGSSAAIALLLFAGDIGAQRATPTTDEYRFEVASIHAEPDGYASSPSPLTPRIMTTPPARFEAHGRLRDLIIFAYGLLPFEPITGPDKMLEQRFGILAKAPDGATLSRDNAPAHLRQLLQDRFQLKARFESEMQSVQVLRRVQLDQLGPHLKVPPADCFPRSSGIDPTPPIPLRCKVQGVVNGHLTAVVANLSEFAALLARIGRRPVVDGTGLEGPFDVDLSFDPSTFSATPQPPVDSLPPFVDALRKELGLKLESERRPVRLLVIDSVAPPTEN